MNPMISSIFNPWYLHLLNSSGTVIIDKKKGEV